MDLLQWLRDMGSPGVSAPGDPSGPVIRRRYRFSGLVQGVGFRWEAKMLAGRLGLTGWVRNECDGTVIVEIEGGAEDADRFLQAMKSVPRFDITDVQAEDLPPAGGERTFDVRY